MLPKFDNFSGAPVVSSVSCQVSRKEAKAKARETGRCRCCMPAAYYRDMYFQESRCYVYT